MHRDDASDTSSHQPHLVPLLPAASHPPPTGGFPAASGLLLAGGLPTASRLPPRHVVTYRQRWQKKPKSRPFVPRPSDPAGPRRVVCINSKGSASCRTVTRRGLVDLFGIPYRDVRFVDPTMPQPYPTAILIREKALVVNLEHIRMVISPDRIVVMSVMHQMGSAKVDCADNHDLACGFIADLQRRAREVKLPGRRAARGRAATMHVSHRTRRWSSSSMGSHAGEEVLPFELRALEGALAEAVRMLEEEADVLEDRTLPAVEAMAKQLTLKNLEEVRECKRELTALSTRIERLRSTLDDILEDDDDMADMYLTRRGEEDAASETTEDLGEGLDEGEEEGEDGGAEEEDKGDVEGPAALDQNGEGVAGGPLPHSDPLPPSPPPSAFGQQAERPLPRNRSQQGGGRLPRGGGSVPEEVLAWMERQGSALEGLLGGVRGGRGTADAAQRERDIEGVENMLETYLMRVEHLGSRMTQLKERIDDTEDLVNIDLDSRRNDIVLVNLIATSVSIVFAFVTSIAGVFGMNLKSGLENSKTAFAVATVLSYLVGFLILWVLVLWYQRRGLTFVPDARILE